MYRAACNNLCKANVLQRFVEKVLFSFPVIIMIFMLSGCINWAHIIESNHLRESIPEGGTMVHPDKSDNHAFINKPRGKKIPDAVFILCTH